MLFFYTHPLEEMRERKQTPKINTIKDVMSPKIKIKEILRKVQGVMRERGADLEIKMQGVRTKREETQGMQREEKGMALMIQREQILTMQRARNLKPKSMHHLIS